METLRLPYQGKYYPLELVADEQSIGVEIRFQCFHFSAHIHPRQPNKQKAIEVGLENFYRQKAIEKIIPRIYHWTAIMQLYPHEIEIKKQHKRWGSCTTKNKLIFNYDMIKLPLDCIDYILVHEIAHLREKSHLNKFWEIVALYLPNYKELKTKITEFEF